VIVDCHCPAGIDRTVIMPTFATNSRRSNEEVAGLVRRDPRRLIGFAWVHPKRDAGKVEDVVRHALRLGLVGIKVHGHDAMPTRELCESAEHHRLPVLVDVYGKAGVIDMFAPEFPAVQFIVPHLGSFADDFRAHQQVIDCLVRLPNVHADTSGVRRFDYLGEAVNRAGPRKILFGSDGPWLHPALELQKIRLLGLRPADERLILGGNIIRLLQRRRAAPKRRPVPTALLRAAN
jgi:predicted TIM-barrel fold metal-dependent hydrolase